MKQTKTFRVKARRPGAYEKLSLRTVQAELLGALESAIQQTLDQQAPSLFAQETKHEKARIVVGFSGGRDSVALLHAVMLLAAKRHSPIEAVWAVHIHHALSPNANRWARFCRQMASELGVPFKVIHVMVKTKGDGVEAAARKARYDALMRAAKSFDANMVMTAHHEDDRLETFLIQWMRGAGVDGLATFPMVREEQGIELVRPWFNVPRAALERFLVLKELPWVDDESNDDVSYLRNAIRHNVLPAMDEARLGFRQAAARSVELMAETSELLREVAQEDLQKVLVTPQALSIAKLMALSVPRQALVLRAWIESFGVAAPSKAKLDEALRQARETHQDTKLTFHLGNYEMKRHGANLVMRKAQAVKKDTTRFETLAWKGEGEYPVASWSGVFKVTLCADGEEGIPEDVLATGTLEVRPRQGGETLRIHRKRPRKHLKYWYQELQIAEFDRQNLPLLWCDDELLHAAALGSEVRMMVPADEADRRYRIEWQPDDTLLSLMQF